MKQTTRTRKLSRSSSQKTSIKTKNLMKPRPRQTPLPLQANRKAERGTTFLESAAVTAATWVLYTGLVKMFTDFCLAHTYPLDTFPAIDTAMVNYFHVLFDDGEEQNAGTRLLSAWKAVHPVSGHLYSRLFPRAERALKGWLKQRPARTRPPMPWIAVVLVATYLLMCPAVLLKEMGLAVLLMFTTYVRPSEMLGILSSELIPPSPPLSHFFAVNLHPEEEGKTSKVGATNESLLLDGPDLVGLGDALHYLALARPTATLFNFEMPHLRKEFELAQQKVGLKRRYVLYQLRHGGPSHDRRENYRSLAAVKQRGRWVTDSSLRRYEAHARLQKEEAQIPAPLRLLAARRTRVLQQLMTEAAVGIASAQRNGPSRGQVASSSWADPGGRLLKRPRTEDTMLNFAMPSPTPSLPNYKTDGVGESATASPSPVSSSILVKIPKQIKKE